MNIYFKVLSYLIAIGVVLVGLYWYGGNKYDEGYAVREAISVKADLAATEKAREIENDWQEKLSKAQNEKTERERKLEYDYANASVANGRLRNDIATIRNKLPELTRDAIEQYANTASIVFGECTDKYTELARTADKIDSDRQTLEKAWPN